MTRPHFLAIDDAPFDKGQTNPVPLVAVMTEGPDRVESITIGAFPVDGADPTGYLIQWLSGSSNLAAVQAVLVGGITIAGLGILDAGALAQGLGRPVLVATRKDTTRSNLASALEAAGFLERLPILERAPEARLAAPGLHLACAGIDWHEGAALVRRSLTKGRFPEPLRLAHLIGQAMVLGQTRGRA